MNDLETQIEIIDNNFLENFAVHRTIKQLIDESSAIYYYYFELKDGANHWVVLDIQYHIEGSLAYKKLSEYVAFINKLQIFDNEQDAYALYKSLGLSKINSI